MAEAPLFARMRAVHDTRADEERVLLFPEKVGKKLATASLREIPLIARFGNGARNSAWLEHLVLGSYFVGLSASARLIRFQTGRGISLRS